MSTSVRLPAAAAGAGAGAAGEAAGEAAGDAGPGTATGAGACGARISNVLGRALLNCGEALTATDPRTRAKLINWEIPGIFLLVGDD